MWELRILLHTDSLSGQSTALKVQMLTCLMCYPPSSQWLRRGLSAHIRGLSGDPSIPMHLCVRACARAHIHTHKIIARKKLTYKVEKHLFLESIWGEQSRGEAKKGRRKWLKITCPFPKLPVLIWSFLFKCTGNRTVGVKDGRHNRRAHSDPMSVAPVASSRAFLLSRSASSDFKDC